MKRNGQNVNIKKGKLSLKKTNKNDPVISIYEIWILYTYKIWYEKVYEYRLNWLDCVYNSE